jgi:hypothetical protein
MAWAISDFSETHTCAYQKLHPAILIVKSAEDRPCGDDTEPLNRTNKRRILTQG